MKIIYLILLSIVFLPDLSLGAEGNFSEDIEFNKVDFWFPPCLSNVGKMSSVNVAICGTEPLRAAQYYDPVGQIVSGADVRNYILSTTNAFNPENVMSQNPSGVFAFFADAMHFGHEYYVHAIIGEELSSGLADLNSPCLQISNPLKVSWFDIPEHVEIWKSGPELNCDHAELTLKPSIETDTTGFEIFWTNYSGEIVSSENEHYVNVIDTGVYSVHVVQPLAQCGASSSVEITRAENVPVAIVSEPDVITCYEPIIELSGEGSSSGSSYLYIWDGPNIESKIGPLNFPVTYPGMYTLTVRDTVIDCESRVEQEVFANQTSPHVEVQVDEMLGCGIKEVELSGEGSDIGLYVGYRWFDSTDSTSITGPTNEIITTAANAGTFGLEVKDYLNGCMDTAWIEVLQNPNEIFDIAYSIENVSCYGVSDGSIDVNSIIGGAEPFDYSFNGGQSFDMLPFVDGLVGGEYVLVIREPTGCQYSDTVTVYAPVKFDVDLGEDLEIELGNSIELNLSVDLPDEFISEIKWSLPEDSINLGFESIVLEPNPGKHEIIVVVEDEFGCISSDSMIVDVLFEKRIFIPEIIKPNSENIANRYLNIYTDSDMVKEIKNFCVFDRYGGKVFERASVPVSEILNMDFAWNGTGSNGDFVSSGIYTYTFEVQFAAGKVDQYLGSCSVVY